MPPSPRSRPARLRYPVMALKRLAEPAGNLTQYVGVQTVDFHATCAWSRYWLDGQRAGDASQMTRALATIEEFPTWQAVSDPRLADDSIRREIGGVVAGARRGDPVPVKLMYDGMICDEALAR